MTIEGIVQEVTLPHGFRINKRNENGVVVCTFSPPVALPYDDEFLSRYPQAQVSVIDNRYLRDLTNAVIKTALPEFRGEELSTVIVGSSQFDIDNSGEVYTGNMDITYYESSKQRCALQLRLKSTGQFYPLLVNGQVKRPTIDEVTVRGEVYLDVQILILTKIIFTATKLVQQLYHHWLTISH